MIGTPDQLTSAVVQKHQVLNQPPHFMIGNCKVDIEFSVKMLRISIDNQTKHSNICKKKKVFINTFILSNFSYCPLVWFISSTKSLNKVENLQKGALRILRILRGKNHPQITQQRLREHPQITQQRLREV